MTHGLEEISEKPEFAQTPIPSVSELLFPSGLARGVIYLATVF